MNRLFASQRDTLRSQVRVHLAKPPSERSPSQPEFETANLPTLVQASPEPSVITSLPQISVSGKRLGPPSRGRGVLALAALVAVAIAIGAGYWRGRSPATTLSRPAPSQAASVPDTAAKVPVLSKARLHLETTPSGAFVEWEGQSFGPTPTDISVAAGTQKLGITAPGYEPEVLTVEVQAGDELSRSVTLRASAAPANPANPIAPTASTRGSKRDAPRPSHGASAAGPTPSVSAAPSATAAPSASTLRVQMLDEGDGK
jgi:hypothetical protein